MTGATPNNSNTDFYIELKRATDVNDLKSLIKKVINRLGFTDYVFVPLERDWKHEKKHGVLSTYPEEYWRIFHEKKLYTHDMVVGFFRKHVHPSHTSYIYNYYADAPFDCELNDKSREIRQLQHAFGFYESYAIPIKTEDRNYLFTISCQNMYAAELQAKANELALQLRSIGNAIAKVCENRFSALLEPEAPNVIDIAPKPLRVLATLANSDMTITNVAAKLSISPITAHQHIAAARKALNKQTNIGAIKVAITQGIISYDEE